MRRRLHGLVVGVLTFSLSFDVASACGHRRRACRPRSCQPAACEPLPQCPTWSAGWHSTWCGPALPVVVVAPVELWAGCAAGYETVAACDPLACCEGTVVEESFVGGGPVEAVGSVEDLAPAAAGSAPATEETAVSRLAAGEPTLSIPPAPLEPVPPRDPEASKSEVEPAAAEQAVADESPVAESEPESEPAEPAPAAPAPRRIPNIFEEVEAASTPAADPAAAEESPVGPVDPQPAPADAAPGVDVVPAEEPPAADAPPPEPPAESVPSADSAGRDPAEPRRRWIDDSGAHAAVGSLVAVHGGTVEILKSNGRMITVPVERLSDFDRDYVASAGARLAARRPQAPARDTAGL